MKKRTIKKSIITITIGVLIGLLMGSITRELSTNYILMFVALLILLITANTIAITDDLDIRVMNAYERGLKHRHVCSCGHAEKQINEDK